LQVTRSAVRLRTVQVLLLESKISYPDTFVDEKEGQIQDHSFDSILRKIQQQFDDRGNRDSRWKNQKSEIRNPDGQMDHVTCINNKTSHDWRPTYNRSRALPSLLILALAPLSQEPRLEGTMGMPQMLLSHSLPSPPYNLQVPPLPLTSHI
jgi:hypothetical protein